MNHKQEGLAQGREALPNAVQLGGSNGSVSRPTLVSTQDVLARRAGVYRHLENCIDLASALQRHFCEIHRDFRGLRLTPDETEDLIEDAWDQLVPPCERTRQQYAGDLVRKWETEDRVQPLSSAKRIKTVSPAASTIEAYQHVKAHKSELELRRWLKDRPEMEAWLGGRR
jgi:hypothetical protein